MSNFQSSDVLASEPIGGAQPHGSTLRSDDDAVHAAIFVQAPLHGHKGQEADNKALAPNFVDTRNFLRALDPAGIFTFQAIPEAKDATARPTVLHGTFDERAAELEALNDSGAGIFVMINAGDGEIKPGAKTCRTQANVTRVRALFVDLDGAPLEPATALEDPPDLVVATSPGRWHIYWLVYDCELHEFRHLQLGLAEEFNGDQSVCDLPRVMRLPGFLHLKSETPFLSHLVEFDRATSGDSHGA